MFQDRSQQFIYFLLNGVSLSATGKPMARIKERQTRKKADGLKKMPDAEGREVDEIPTNYLN